MNLTLLIFQFIDGMKSITTALFQQAPLHLKSPPCVDHEGSSLKYISNKIAWEMNNNPHAL